MDPSYEHEGFSRQHFVQLDQVPFEPGWAGGTRYSSSNVKSNRYPVIAEELLVIHAEAFCSLLPGGPIVVLLIEDNVRRIRL